MRRVAGVAEVGPIGVASGTIITDSKNPKLDVSLIGVQPNLLGMPPVKIGNTFHASR